MPDPEKARILHSKVNQTLKELRRLDKSTIKDVLRDLKRTRLEISEIFKGAERFEMPYYRAILGEIDEKIAGFRDRMSGSVLGAQDISFSSGANLSDDILKTAGVVFGLPAISDELLVTAKEFSADLITDMSNEMRTDISRSLRRSLLMGENQFDSARRIDKIIGTKKTLGYMNRADKISRTEIGRAFSIARQAKDEAVAEQVPQMKKQWVTSQDTRVRNKDMGGGRGIISHVAAHGQIRKIDEPFDVGGERLMYPRDERGSPANTVNCRCQSIPYMEEWE